MKSKNAQSSLVSRTSLKACVCGVYAELIDKTAVINNDAYLKEVGGSSIQGSKLHNLINSGTASLSQSQ